MNSNAGVAQNNTAAPTTAVNTPTGTVLPVSVTTGIGKEGLPVKVSSQESVSEVTSEVELPQEVEKAGVVSFKETIELPPDVKNLGVTQTGASTPLQSTPALPQVDLPISDSQVVVGLHESIGNAFRWLATWCIKKLKKAHVALKVIHGQIIRVKA
jgi:hypothetical protein